MEKEDLVRTLELKKNKAWKLVFLSLTDIDI